MGKIVTLGGGLIDKNSPFFFNQLLDRVNTYEIDFCNKQFSKLNTDYAKKVLSEKIHFLENFVSQLSFEIEGTDGLYRINGL